METGGLKVVKVYAPASIGNVSVGFDVLGAAVSPIDGTLLGDCVTVKSADGFSLKNEGRFVSKLPKNLNTISFINAGNYFVSGLATH